MSRRGRVGRHARTAKYWTPTEDEGAVQKVRASQDPIPGGHPFGCVFMWDRFLGAQVCVTHMPRIDEMAESS